MASNEETNPINLPRPKRVSDRQNRIKNKGTDRLAFITGQLRELPPGPESESERRHSHTASCPPDLSRDNRQSDRPSFGSIVEDKVTDNLLGNQDSPGHSNKYEGENRTGSPFMHKCESNREANRASALDLHSKESPSQSAVNSAISASEGDHHLKQTGNYQNMFTPYKVISAIKACESSRLRCSLAAAILVVLCYLGFPILGTNVVKGIILFRPLFLLVLTNITIVVRHLLLEDAGGGSGRIQQEASNAISGDETDLADRVGKALELGLMLQKIIGAIFIDSSVYAISVICSLSFSQKLGW